MGGVLQWIVFRLSASQIVRALDAGIGFFATKGFGRLSGNVWKQISFLGIVWETMRQRSATVSTHLLYSRHACRT